MSVAIVAMTDKNSTNPDFPEFNWGEREKSLVLSSFFWGYVVTQVPGGQMAKVFGGKIMLLTAITLCSLLNLLTPKFASFGDWPAVACLRVVQGLCQGVIFPSTHTLLAKWVCSLVISVNILIAQTFDEGKHFLFRLRRAREVQSGHTVTAVRSLALL
jgi:MFS transporter, ACS family, solute carrier family 17 (sodium-dependent inorganic phosphate cotransporter), member 5